MQTIAAATTTSISYSFLLLLRFSLFIQVNTQKYPQILKIEVNKVCIWVWQHWGGACELGCKQVTFFKTQSLTQVKLFLSFLCVWLFQAFLHSLTLNIPGSLTLYLCVGREKAGVFLALNLRAANHVENQRQKIATQTEMHYVS